MLVRDLGRCFWCGRPLGDALNVHHRLLRSHGTDNRAGNLIALCGSGTTGCHGGVHREVGKARRRGHIVPSWQEPANVLALSWRGWVRLDNDGGLRVVAVTSDALSAWKPEPGVVIPSDALNVSQRRTGPQT